MSNSIAETEVLVAGGGPAGLAAAIAARQVGLEATVVDCAHPPVDKACGEGIMPDGLRALHRLGVSIGPGQAEAFRGIRFIDGPDQVTAFFPKGVGYGTRRVALHQLLVDRAEETGVAVHWGMRITGLSERGLSVNGETVRSRWLVCADGQNSHLRRVTNLDMSDTPSVRYGFRCHYNVAPWSDLVEVHWSDCGQMYVTPVAADQVCVALITRERHLRFDDVLPRFYKLFPRLRNAAPVQDLKGAVTATRKLARVCRDRIALVGEASGSVDAITGEGLSMAFLQAHALAEAMRRGRMKQYQLAHRLIARRPQLMARMMLAMDAHPSFRRRVFRAFQADASCFHRMLAVHLGTISPADLGLRCGLTLGWRLLAP